MSVRGGIERAARCLLGAFAVAISMAVPLSAQDLTVSSPAPQSDSAQTSLPIIAFDRERIQTTSQMGQDLAAQIDALQQALVEENAHIAEDLEAEEREITALKGTLSAEDFALRAAAFDAKATRLRMENAEKVSDVEEQSLQNSRIFEQTLRAVLTDIAREVGALAVFEIQQIYLRSETIDVSTEAIRRLDAQLQSGADGADGVDEAAIEAIDDTK